MWWDFIGVKYWIFQVDIGIVSLGLKDIKNIFASILRKLIEEV